jgi:hypothetical protein
MNGFEKMEEIIKIRQAGRIAAAMGFEPGWHIRRRGLWLAAFHESGHAVFDWIGGKKPYCVYIEPDGSGRVCFGEEAVQKPSSECVTDQQKIEETVEILTVCEHPPDLRELARQTENTLREHWLWVRRLARELVIHRKLYTADLEQILNDLPVSNAEELPSEAAACPQEEKK